MIKICLYLHFEYILVRYRDRVFCITPVFLHQYSCLSDEFFTKNMGFLLVVLLGFK